MMQSASQFIRKNKKIYDADGIADVFDTLSAKQVSRGCVADGILLKSGSRGHGCLPHIDSAETFTRSMTLVCDGGVKWGVFSSKNGFEETLRTLAMLGLADDAVVFGHGILAEDADECALAIPERELRPFIYDDEGGIVEARMAAFVLQAAEPDSTSIDCDMAAFAIVNYLTKHGVVPYDEYPYRDVLVYMLRSRAANVSQIAATTIVNTLGINGYLRDGIVSGVR